MPRTTNHNTVKYMTTFWIMYFAVFLSSFYLFFNQSIGSYSSNLLTAINSAVAVNSTDNSLFAIVARFIHSIMGNVGICGFLSLIVVFGIYGSYKLLVELVPKADKTTLHLFGFAVNFIGVFYLPNLTYKSSMTLGYVWGNLWHDPDYILGKTLAVVMAIFLIRAIKTIDKVNNIDILMFALFLTLATWALPNIALILLPTLFIYGLTVNFLDRWRNLKNWMIFGFFCIPSLAFLVLQGQTVVTNNTFSINTGLIYNTYTEKFTLTLILSALFIITGLIVNIAKLKSFTIIGIIMAIVAFLEGWFFVEAGDRLYQGNWTWGLNFALFLLNILVISLVLNNKDRINLKVFPLIIFFIQLAMGIFYYILLLGGFGF